MHTAPNAIDFAKEHKTSNNNSNKKHLYVNKRLFKSVIVIKITPIIKYGHVSE